MLYRESDAMISFTEENMEPVSTIQEPVQAQTQSQNVAGQQSSNIVQLIYILYSVGIFVQVLFIVAGILAMVKKSDTSDPFANNHYVYQWKTFKYGSLSCILGLLVIFAGAAVPSEDLLGLGVLIMFVAGLWSIVRVIKGFIRFGSNKLA